MKTRSLPSVAKRTIEIMAMAAAYYVVGRLALLLAIPPGYATAVWPASGIALAGTLLFGYRVWPGILLGSFLVNVWTSLDTSSAVSILTSLALATSIGAGASLQAIAGAFLIRRLVEYPTTLFGVQDVIKFVVLAGPVSCLVNSTWSVTSLLLGGIIQRGDYPFHWWTWWVGDTIGVVTFSPLVLIWAAKPPAVSLRRQISVSIPLGLAFALVVIIFVYAGVWEQNRVKLEFERRTDNLTQALKENFDNYVDVLYSIDSFFASSVKVERQEFKNFVSRLLLRHPGIRALSWNPSIRDTQRTALEEAARRDGFSGFQVTERNSQEELVQAGRRDEYIPVYYIEPYARNESALGFDVASDPIINEALNRARDTGKPTATHPITLVQDMDRELGFLVFLPIYRYGLPSPEDPRLTLQGYAIGALRISDMVQASLKSMEATGIGVRLYDETNGDKKRLLYRSQALESKVLPPESEQLMKPAALQRLTPFVVAGRRWVVQYTPTKEYLSAQRSWPAWGVPAGGLLFTAFLGAFLLVVTGHTAELQTINIELQKEIVERKRAEEATRKLNMELEVANKELESFSYSVSHDLRAPLRSVNGFSQALVEDYSDKLDAQAQDYIQRVRAATLRMDQLIHDLLQLSQVTRSEMRYEIVDLSRLAERIAAEFRESGSSRKVEFSIEPKLKASGDPRLLRIALENLFNNAWKFTGKQPQSKIEFGATEYNGKQVFFVCDNGAGFDMAYAGKLFGAFQRLHNAAEYPGTGVGLATVQRIIHRHGGQVWAESTVGNGATFYFSL